MILKKRLMIIRKLLGGLHSPAPPSPVATALIIKTYLVSLPCDMGLPIK